MALTPDGILKRADERLQREAEERLERAERMRRRFLRYFDSHTYSFRFRGSLLVAKKDFHFPTITITHRPLALVTRLRCANQRCGREYDVNTFTDIDDDLFWMPCPNEECHWPITLQESIAIYGNNTFPVAKVKAGMDRHHVHTTRYKNWLRAVIDHLWKMIEENPEHKESILWDEDDELPEVRMRTNIESDEETLDSITKEAAKTWGFGKAEIPKKYER